MPYIKQSSREYLDPIPMATTPGELNYLFSVIAHKYFITYGGRGYNGINDVLGALEGAKQEFYRRVAVPYEETKMKENGDVYNV